jgi:hypothetical protein
LELHWSWDVGIWSFLHPPQKSRLRATLARPGGYNVTEQLTKYVREPAA